MDGGKNKSKSSTENLDHIANREKEKENDKIVLNTELPSNNSNQETKIADEVNVDVEMTENHNKSPYESVNLEDNKEKVTENNLKGKTIEKKENSLSSNTELSQSFEKNPGIKSRLKKKTGMKSHEEEQRVAPTNESDKIAKAIQETLTNIAKLHDKPQKSDISNENEKKDNTDKNNIALKAQIK